VAYLRDEAGQRANQREACSHGTAHGFSCLCVGASCDAWRWSSVARSVGSMTAAPTALVR
jgi:hypothetical protein